MNKIKKFTTSVIEFAKSGFKYAPDFIKTIRLDLCSKCEKLSDDKKTCSECGCYLDIKTGWATESCPLGKWDALPVLQQEKKPCGGCNKQNKKSE